MEAAHCPCSMTTLAQTDYLRSLQFMAPPEIGVFAALDYCGRNNLRTPRWAALGATKALAALLLEAPRALGRSNHPIARYIENLRHIARYQTFIEMRRKQEELEELPELTSRRKTAPRGLEIEYGQKEWLRGNKEHLYRCASVELRGTCVASSPGQIAKSVKLLECDSSLVEIHQEALRALKLPGPNQLIQRKPLGPGVKSSNTKPFYELPV